MEPTPPLLETYEEGRLLLEAKGWGIAKAAEHLSELPGMARFHISHTKLSKKTTPGADNPIEPEVAAAIEAMPTWRGHERKTEIVIKGLLARHGAPPPSASQRIGQRASRFLRGLAERFGRVFWTRIAVTAASGALVGCLALVTLAPLLAGAARPEPFVLVLPGAGPDGSTVGFDPRSLIDKAAEWGEKPLDQPIPVKTLPGQKVAPCDARWGEEAINGNCWVWIAAVKPPCGLLFRQGDKCYRPVAAEPKKPAP
jgi:hypothetical protein